MLLPRAFEMTAAVVVLALAVRALAGGATGLVAALVLALSPAAVAVGRGNVADPLMILLLVAATWAVARALGSAARRGALVVGLVAVLVLPVAATAGLLALGGGAFDTPFETAREARAVRALPVAEPRFAASTVPALQRAREGAPDLLAVQSSAVASVFACPTGEEVLRSAGSPAPGRRRPSRSCAPT